jgi:hypothetical protein
MGSELENPQKMDRRTPAGRNLAIVFFQAIFS